MNLQTCKQDTEDKQMEQFATKTFEKWVVNLLLKSYEDLMKSV